MSHQTPPPQEAAYRAALLRWIRSFKREQEIADKLFVSIRTVHWHTQSIYQKLNVHRRVQAVNVARERGLL